MPEQTRFLTQDAVSLGGTLFGDPDRAHTALLLTSGTGIPQGFYRRFAAFAAKQGFVVLSFDYRGIGESAPENLRSSSAVYRDWGQLDVPAATRHLQAHAPGLPLVVVGHSTGGQQLGLSESFDQVQAALFVAVSTGYWRGMPWAMGWFSLMLWKLLVPVADALLGRFPAKRVGLGEDLPIGVAREWGAWCLEPNYLAAYFDGAGKRSPDGREFGPQFFEKVRFPIRSLNFVDDAIATPENVPPLLALYGGAEIHVEWVEPDSIGAQSIGHLGFFRTGAQVLWKEQLNWLQKSAHRERRS